MICCQMSGLFLNLPTTVSPVSVVKISPVVPAGILDHYLRRSASPSQPRVIGTLLGHRTEDGKGIEVQNCFPVPHTEDKDQIAVDMEYHKTMFELHKKVNPRQMIVGWYATGPGISVYAALVQEFFSKATAPLPSVHLTLDTDLTGNEMGIKTFISYFLEF